MTDLEALKAEAGAEAVDRFVRSGMRLGLGSGSTAAKMLDALGERLASGVLSDIAGVPTSAATAARCGELGIPLLTLEDVAELDVVIDGADEIDPSLDLIKGLGGAHLREKVVASAARRMVVVADETKIVSRLGERAPLPVEVIPFAMPVAERLLRDLGGSRSCASTTGARSSPTRATASCTARGSSGSTPRRWRAMSRTSRASSSTGSSSGSPRRRSSLRATAFACWTAQSPLHDGDGLRALVDQDVAPAELRRRGAERARAGEEVEHAVARAGRGLAASGARSRPASGSGSRSSRGRSARRSCATRRRWGASRGPPSRPSPAPAPCTARARRPRSRTGTGPGRARRPGSCRASPASAAAAWRRSRRPTPARSGTQSRPKTSSSRSFT